jgi:Putative peptidoglycan binding domain
MGLGARLRSCVQTALICIPMIFGSSLARGADITQVQEMLLWTGHYDGIVTGTANDYTLDAIKAFQRSLGHAPTGQLSAAELNQLGNKANQLKTRAGFQVIYDPSTGIRIGMPLGMVSGKNATKWGSNWASSDNGMDIDTLRFVGGPSLDELYRKLTTISGRKLRYSPLRSDWFVLEGQDSDGRQMYVRAMARGDEVRAFSATYERSYKDRAFPAIMAMSASFQPFAASPQAPSAPDTGPPSRPPSPPDADGDCFNGLGKACPNIALGGSAR